MFYKLLIVVFTCYSFSLSASSEAEAQTWAQIAQTYAGAGRTYADAASSSATASAQHSNRSSDAANISLDAARRAQEEAEWMRRINEQERERLRREGGNRALVELVLVLGARYGGQAIGENCNIL